MLTLKMLKDMPPHTIFATGIAKDSVEELNMFGGGRNLRWVAKRGGIYDWAIYAHHSDYSISEVASIGDKVFEENHIKNLVPCDDEAYAMYRR